MPDLSLDHTGAAVSGVSERCDAWLAFDMAAFIAEWTDLASRSAEPNPFHEAWYLLPALRALDPSGRVHLFTLRVDGNLVGLVPINARARYYGRPIPHRGIWTHGNSFLCTPLIAAGHEHDFWRALLRWSDRQTGPALFLHVPNLPLEGPAHRALAAVCAETRRTCALVHREERAMLSSALSADDYAAASLSGKKRKELRRQAARLGEQGAVRFERRDDAAGLGEWTDQFLILEAAGWKGQAGSALACSPATTALFRDALSRAAALGRVERLTLYLDDIPIAMLAQFLAAPGAFSFKTAFDEAYARFSPGVLLQMENLALLHRTDVDWCDSCAAADHPMIDHIWRERRAIGRLSVAIGGPLRRALFQPLARFEQVRTPPA